MKALLLVFALAFIAALAGMSQAPPAAAPDAPRGSRRAGSPPAAQSDAQLEAAIRARFAASRIARNAFQVRVQGGIATLTGRTDVLQHKGVATRLARSAGARQVVNRIEVAQSARDRAAANLSKGRRRAQIKRSESGARSEPRQRR